MKRIIYILDDDRRSFAYERVKGFCRAVKNTETPANLYIFRSNGFAGYDKAHNCGEYNIYRLPDFNDFDGIILDINNSHNTAENIYGDIGASYVMRAAAASGKPVISIGNNIEGFYYIGIDNYSAMTSVITYLHEELGLNDFWFLMGPVDNYENRIRTKALREYCEEHGIPCETSRFYFESFDMESGINGFKRLYSLYNGKLPQVLICANDPIASGAVRTAGDMGIRIPKDLFVTGFDNQDISKYITPSVTTVEQNRHAMGEEG
ncbi:MAG: substrate-binding domain-containing protein, partial [Lachnospiraceae bacterium]|nr:substrate-binding domain-containing protein [Lachnospiraceae bacterium]